ncbi:MAG TPA: hypothetical protein VH559_05540 [Gemmatimonadaceae bacterium]
MLKCSCETSHTHLIPPADAKSLVADERRHSVARLGAGGANVGTVGELVVVSDASARLLTRAAQLGAGAAHDDVKRRPAQHEVRARLARLGAIEKDADKIHFRVLTVAVREAVLERDRADGVAVETLFDAFLHRVVRVIVRDVSVGFLSHWGSSGARLDAAGMRR